MSRVPMFSSPLLLGFDQLERTLERLAKNAEGYPPYNIERIGDHGLRIILAVAGFTSDDLVIEFAQPLEASSPVAQDIERSHEGIYSVSYKVRDLAQAEEYLARKGVAFIYNDGTTLVTDRETSQGCVMSFTTWAVPIEQEIAIDDL